MSEPILLTTCEECTWPMTEEYHGVLVCTNARCSEYTDTGVLTKRMSTQTIQRAVTRDALMDYIEHHLVALNDMLDKAEGEGRISYTKGCIDTIIAVRAWFDETVPPPAIIPDLSRSA